MSSIKGLYVLTDENLISESDLNHCVEQAIIGGASVVQYRNKKTPYQAKVAQAESLLQICNLHSVPLIINDDIGLCADIGADGVHLGQSDGDISDAREHLGSEAIIGITCHNSIKLALDAQEAGADYVAFGRFFPSNTKPDAQPAQLAILEQASKMLEIPSVAIGGITKDNAAKLIEAGASSIAVAGSVFSDPDPKAQAEKLSGLFSYLN